MTMTSKRELCPNSGQPRPAERMVWNASAIGSERTLYSVAVCQVCWKPRVRLTDDDRYVEHGKGG